jgi:ferrous iron transport protein A
MNYISNLTKNKHTLDKIPLNTEVKIKNINHLSTSMVRLMEMGLIPGEKIKILQIAPLGDPIEILVMGYKLCIRKSDASNIEVEYETNN